MDELILPAEHWQGMFKHIQSHLPEEACGLLAGTGRQVLKVYPVANKLHSSVRFRMDEQALVNAMVDIEIRGWQLIAIYHSHPQGPCYPSLTDQQDHYYPDSLSVIWFPILNQWQCRAYQMDMHGYHEVAVQMC
jgi:proteasome lid subunit RPN8/RPN11